MQNKSLKVKGGCSRFNVKEKYRIYIHTAAKIKIFDYPNYAYAFEGDTMWYAGRKDQDIHIIKMKPNKDEYEVVVKDTTETDNDMDAYLVEYLILHEKSFPMTPWEIKEISIEDILSELPISVKKKLFVSLQKSFSC